MIQTMSMFDLAKSMHENVYSRMHRDHDDRLRKFQVTSAEDDHTVNVHLQQFVPTFRSCQSSNDLSLFRKKEDTYFERPYNDRKC